MKVFAILTFIAVFAFSGHAEVIKTHAYSLVGKAKYSADFKHLDYVNPNAPKGGELRMSAFGTYDSFNSFAIKGRSAVGVGGYLYDSLMESSDDEPSTYYGLLAESIEYSDDYSFVVFNLRKGAKWHDGKPITAEDVVFSFYKITEVSPFYSNYFKLVRKVIALDSYRVRFEFDEKEPSYEMPLIAGQLTIIPKHYWEKRDLSKSTLDVPLGSGPYRIGSFEAGKRISFERVPDYWGRDVPVNVGRYNADKIIYEYFRDQTVSFEAFKAGHYDLRSEGSSQRWYKGYTGKYHERGLIKKEEVPHKKPMGMAGLVMNTSNSFLKDINLRKALTYAYDFEWVNSKLYYGQNIRHRSYFSNSELMASGDAPEAEKKILKSVGADVERYASAFKLPETDGEGNNRAGLMQGVNILTSNGYSYKDGKMFTPDGRKVSLEVLTSSKSIEKRLMPFKKALERMGIDLYIRYVDSTQYVRKVRNKEYDMIFTRIKQSLSPGNEQRNMWHSSSADEVGSKNYAKIQNPVVDKLIDKLVNSEDRETLVTVVKALDRVLLNGYYIIPSGYSNRYRVGYWDKFGKPEKAPEYSFGFGTWWIIPEKAAYVDSQVNR